MPNVSLLPLLCRQAIMVMQTDMTDKVAAEVALMGMAEGQVRVSACMCS